MSVNISNEEMAALTVADLLPMVEAATGPNYELERMIWHKLVFDPALAKADDSYLKLVGSRLPPYTASLDAVLALVERVLPGWMKFVGDLDPSDMRACATITHERPPTPPHRGFAPQGQYALALLAALLKALIAQAATADPQGN